MSEADPYSSVEPEFTDVEALPHDPIMKADGSPISGRLVLLVTGIVVVVVVVTAVFAFSQGVLSFTSGS